MVGQIKRGGCADPKGRCLVASGFVPCPTKISAIAAGLLLEARAILGEDQLGTKENVRLLLSAPDQLIAFRAFELNMMLHSPLSLTA
jgi:hypothetical protein